MTGVPWGVTFPRGSLAFAFQYEQHWLTDEATESLPVHPLQLYFVLAASATYVILIWLQRQPTRPGTTQFVFYLLFFATTALLEPLRANYLTLNNFLVPLASALLGVLLFIHSSNDVFELKTIPEEGRSR